MKKIWIIFLASLMLFSLVGCQKEDPASIYEYTSFIIYNDGSSHVPGVIEYDENSYVLKRPREVTREQQIENRTIEWKGDVYDLIYVHTVQFEGEDYAVRKYYNRAVPGIVGYIKDTDQIVELNLTPNGTSLVDHERELETEEDFIALAREIAADYTDDLDERVVSVEYREPPAPNTANNYRGDRYVFTKQLNGMDTTDQVVISITPEGLVGQIERTGIGQFDAFAGLNLEAKTVEGLAADAANRIGKYHNGDKVNGRTYDYYLLNDAGTLCLFVDVELDVSPYDEDTGRYDTSVSDKTSVTFIVPLAELVED